MLVVDYLFAHINGRSIEIKGLFYGNYRAIYAGAVPAWRS
jgi:hypothetical protein